MAAIDPPGSTPPEDLTADRPLPISASGTGVSQVLPPRRDPSARQSSNGGDEINDLEDLLSKLNPMAEEFVPPSLANARADGFYHSNNGFNVNTSNGLLLRHHRNENGNYGTENGFRDRRKSNYSHRGRKTSSRTSMAQREERIRRTVYVSDIDLQVTEEQLAALFINCGQVNDCRICGDPNSVLRFAFVEFNNEESARAALNLAGTVLGFYPVRVLPSKTAIAPVNPTFLPRSEDEREMCTRTIYCTNIDKKVTHADVKLFFESICGEVYRLRLLGDYQHATRIAFVEFVSAESAIAALNCSGVVLGSLPIRYSSLNNVGFCLRLARSFIFEAKAPWFSRVSPSKTPVRPGLAHQPVN